MQDTGYIDFYPGARIPNPASIGAEMAQTMINANKSLEVDALSFSDQTAREITGPGPFSIHRSTP
jgi:hypothetical protein